MTEAVQLESINKETEDTLYPDKTSIEAEQVDNPNKDQSEFGEADKVAEDNKGETLADADKESSEEIEYKLELDKESYLDNSHVESVTAFAKENNLSNEKAQAILSKQEETISNYIEAAVAKEDAEIAEWRDSVVKDPVMGGDNLNKTVESARRVVDKFGSEAFTDILRDTGYGDHPEVVRFLSRLGSVMSEDSLIMAGDIGTKDVSVEDLFYKKQDN